MGTWVYYPEGPDSLVATLRRATVQETDDSGSQQILKKVDGLASETFTDIYRFQPHGFTSVPFKGSEGKFLSLGGRADRIMALGFEHKDKRLRNLPEGAAALYYDQTRYIVVLPDKIEINGGGKDVIVDNARDITATASRDITATASNKLTAKAGVRAAIGVNNGRWINCTASRVNLGVSDPDENAPCRVSTECGNSEIVWARID